MVINLTKMAKTMETISQIRQDVYSYFSETTVHGFRYVVEGKNLFEKMFWFLLIIIGFLISGIIIKTSFSDWERTPLQTTIDTVSRPIEQLDFPAITVCNPSELQMPRRNRWMFLEKLLNLIDVNEGKIRIISITYPNFLV